MRPLLIIIYQWNGSLVTVKDDMTNLAKICAYRHFGSHFDDLNCSDHDMSDFCRRFRRFRGKNFAEFLKNVFVDASNEQIQACADEFFKMQQEFNFTTVAGYTGITSTIRRLHKMHAKQIISTHYPQDRIVPWVGKKNLEFAVKQVMGCESGTLWDHISCLRKAHPEHKIVLVSDKPADMEAGADYCVGFITQEQIKENSKIGSVFREQGANQVITKISDLIPFVSRLKEIIICNWA